MIFTLSPSVIRITVTNNMFLLIVGYDSSYAMFVAALAFSDYSKLSFGRRKLASLLFLF